MYAEVELKEKMVLLPRQRFVWSQITGSYKSMEVKPKMAVVCAHVANEETA